MSILWFGGEMGSVTPSETAVIETTSTSYYDTAFSRCGVQIPGGSSLHPDTTYCESPSWVAATDIYVHGRTTGYGAAVGHSVIELLNGSGAAIVRLRQSSSGTSLTLEYLNAGSVWTQAGAAATVSGAAVDIDIHAAISASGSLTVYLAGTSRITATGLALSHLTGVCKARFISSFSAAGQSQMIAADESTIGMRVGTIYMSGQGSTHTFTTGGFANIDEAVYSDADFINSDTAAQVELFTGTTVPSFTSYKIRALAIYARAKKGGAAPTQMQLALRSAGTTYFSSTMALDVGYGAIGNVWETNPATSAAFLSSEIAALEYGVKSIT